jgi:hypothetical protein
MLTIISANFKAKDYLEYNDQLIKKTSPLLDFNWLVVENSPEPEKIILGNCEVIGGCKYEDIPPDFVNKHSYHHAAALDKAIQHRNKHTRYVLFCDPDFFVFKDYINIIDYMNRENIAVFGAPYYPIPGKPRIHNIPVAFNMLVDTNLVDIHKWSFRPTGVEASGLIGDTGVNIYRDIQTKHKSEAVKPHSTGDSDKYFWRGSLYGIHYHAKLHLRKGAEELKQRVKGQLAGLKGLVNDKTI